MLRVLHFVLQGMKRKRKKKEVFCFALLFVAFVPTDEWHKRFLWISQVNCQILEPNTRGEHIRVTNPGQEGSDLCFTGQRRQDRLRGRGSDGSVGDSAMSIGTLYVTLFTDGSQVLSDLLPMGKPQLCYSQ